MDKKKRRGLRHGVDENPISTHDQHARTWLRQRTPQMLIVLSVILTSWIDVRDDDTNRERTCQPSMSDLIIYDDKALNASTWPRARPFEGLSGGHRQPPANRVPTPCHTAARSRYYQERLWSTQALLARRSEASALQMDTLVADPIHDPENNDPLPTC